MRELVPVMASHLVIADWFFLNEVFLLRALDGATSPLCCLPPPPPYLLKGKLVSGTGGAI